MRLITHKTFKSFFFLGLLPLFLAVLFFSIQFFFFCSFLFLFFLLLFLNCAVAVNVRVMNGVALNCLVVGSFISSADH